MSSSTLLLRPPSATFGPILSAVYGTSLLSTLIEIDKGKYSHRFVIELLHWHKVCELGGDKLHRPPVVA